MNDSAKQHWMPLLQRLSTVMLNSDFAEAFSEEAISTGWCGQPPATEDEIVEAETRLGMKLPPSYRAFLLVSNGWRTFNSFVERLLPVQEIDRYRFRDPQGFASFERAREYGLELHGYHPVTDEVYLDYETPEHNAETRDEYYGDSILISEGYESELVLLNPFIVSADGELETIFSAHWIPGNERFRSFGGYVEKVVRDEEQYLANKPDGRRESDDMSYPPNLFQGDE